MQTNGARAEEGRVHHGRTRTGVGPISWAGRGRVGGKGGRGEGKGGALGEWEAPRGRRWESVGGARQREEGRRRARNRVVGRESERLRCARNPRNYQLASDDLVAHRISNQLPQQAFDVVAVPT